MQFIRDFWESNDLCGIVLYAVIAVVAIGGITCAVRYSKARKAQMESFAREHGWAYSRSDTDKLSTRIEPLLPRQSLGMSKIITVEQGERNIRIFDCSHAYWNRSKSQHFRTGCLVESSRFRKTGASQDSVQVLERLGSDQNYADDQFDLGEGEFRKQFVIASKNKTASQAVLTPALQDLLVKYRTSQKFTNVSVALNSTGALVLIGDGAPNESMLELIELCKNIEQSR